MNDYPQCYVHDLPKARKQHRCCECRGLIHPGEKYHYHHGIWDGCPDSFKVCVECEQLRCEIDARVDFDDRVYYGGLGEHVQEEGDPVTVKRFVEIKHRRQAAGVDMWEKMLANL